MSVLREVIPSRLSSFTLAYPQLRATSPSQHPPLIYIFTSQGSPALPNSNAGRWCWCTKKHKKTVATSFSVPLAAGLGRLVTWSPLWLWAGSGDVGLAQRVTILSYACASGRCHSGTISDQWCWQPALKNRNKVSKEKIQNWLLKLRHKK